MDNEAAHEWRVTDVPPAYETTEHPKYPQIRVEVARCDAESPSWGWEGEGEQCQRPPHEGDPWHYLDFVRGVIWWTDSGLA